LEVSKSCCPKPLQGTDNFFSHTEDKIFVKDNNYFESFTRVKRLSFASKKEGVCLRFVADGFTFVSDPIAFFDVQFRDGGKLKVQSKDMSDILDYYLLCNAQKRA
jgi:hypothetical protein